MIQWQEHMSQVGVDVVLDQQEILIRYSLEGSERRPVGAEIGNKPVLAVRAQPVEYVRKGCPYGHHVRQHPNLDLLEFLCVGSVRRVIVEQVP